MEGAATERWIHACARATLTHAPGIHPDDAVACAKDMHRYWPKLTPEKAAECYFSPLVLTPGSTATELA